MQDKGKLSEYYAILFNSIDNEVNKTLISFLAMDCKLIFKKYLKLVISNLMYNPRIYGKLYLFLFVLKALKNILASDLM